MDRSKNATATGSPGSIGAGTTSGANALATTREHSTTTVAIPIPTGLSSGGPLGRWPVSKDFRPTDDAGFRRAAESTFAGPCKLGAMSGFGVAGASVALIGLCFLVMPLTGAAIGALLITLLTMLLSAVMAPKVFEKVNDTSGVKLYKNADMHLTGYFYGLGMGFMFWMLPLAAALVLLLKR